jgi:hypothetical protein
MMLARPWARWAERPGRRAIDSPMPLSGSLPMSSAVTDSTTCAWRFLVFTALCSERRKPVTTIVSLSVSVAGCAAASAVVGWAVAVLSAVCALAGVASIAMPSASGLAAIAKRLVNFVVFILIVPSKDRRRTTQTGACHMVETYQSFRRRTG